MKVTNLLVVAVFVAVAGLFACTASAQAPSARPVPKGTPEKILDKAAVGSLIEEFSRNLWDLVGDEDDADTIKDRWKVRTDIVGKTRSQALHLLFEDVIAVVQDDKKRNKVWLTWETNERNPPKQPPAAEGDCSKAKTELGTIKFYNETRGYGYIIRQGGAELFLHRTAIIGSGEALRLKEGDRVRFLVVKGPKNLLAKCVAKVKK